MAHYGIELDNKKIQLYNNMWIYLINLFMIIKMLSYSTLIIRSFNDESLMIKFITMNY
jgi:hypothetical protein